MCIRDRYWPCFVKDMTKHFGVFFGSQSQLLFTCKTRMVVYRHYLGEVENDYISVWQIYSEQCVPNFIRISRVLQKRWQNILVCFFGSQWTEWMNRRVRCFCLQKQRIGLVFYIGLLFSEFCSHQLVHYYAVGPNVSKHWIVLVFTADFIVLCIVLYFSFFSGQCSVLLQPHRSASASIVIAFYKSFSHRSTHRRRTKIVWLNRNSLP